MSYSLHRQFNGFQSFILFLKSWINSAFLMFSGRISQSFAPIFETLSLSYLHDLMIHLSMQLFLLRSYEWSLNLKISVIVSGATRLFTLNISVDSTWIFLSWIVYWLILLQKFPKRRAIIIVINKSQSTFTQLVYLVINLSSMTLQMSHSSWIARL